MNPMEEDPSKNKQLQQLVEALTNQIGHLFSNNDQIREILERIEKEGYQVDLVVASLSRILSQDDDSGDAIDDDAFEEKDEAYELNPFDYAFLQAIKVRP
jgi:hypothetical protein